MAETQKFTSQRQHTRLRFSPLTVSCQLSCLTPLSPPVQNLDATGDEPGNVYNPDRRLSPCVIRPEVRATDPDGIYADGAANASLSLDAMRWTIAGEPIASVWREGTDYAIDRTESEHRGELTVWRNLAPEEQAQLRFAGTFYDWRTGISYNVESDLLMLRTTSRAESPYACSVDYGVVRYDIVRDRLWLYDFLAARGEAPRGGRDAYRDAHSYERTVTVSLVRGRRAITSLPAGVTMQVLRLGDASETPIVAGSLDAPELVEATFPRLVFDLRLAEGDEYAVRFVEGGVELCRTTVAIYRRTTMPTLAKPARGADLTVRQKQYTNMALLSLANRAIDYPEAYYQIGWHSQSMHRPTPGGLMQYDAEQALGQGADLGVRVAQLGIGEREQDAAVEVWFDLAPHAALAPALVADAATDAAAEVWTDEHGTPYII